MICSIDDFFLLTEEQDQVVVGRPREFPRLFVPRLTGIRLSSHLMKRYDVTRQLQQTNYEASCDYDETICLIYIAYSY